MFLTHLQPMSHFYAPWKHHGFLMFSEGIEVNIGWEWVKFEQMW